MEVVDHPSHGRTAIATRSFAPGDIVLQEVPLMTWESEFDEQEPDSLYQQLNDIVTSVNVMFEQDTEVHAVHTDSAFALFAFLTAEQSVRSKFVHIALFLP